MSRYLLMVCAAAEVSVEPAPRAVPAGRESGERWQSGTIGELR
jgi:hypothetical protein